MVEQGHLTVQVKQIVFALQDISSLWPDETVDAESEVVHPSNVRQRRYVK